MCASEWSVLWSHVSLPLILTKQVEIGFGGFLLCDFLFFAETFFTLKLNQNKNKNDIFASRLFSLLLTIVWLKFYRVSK